MLCMSLVQNMDLAVIGIQSISEELLVYVGVVCSIVAVNAAVVIRSVV